MTEQHPQALLQEAQLARHEARPSDPRMEVLDLLRQPPEAVAAFKAEMEQLAVALINETHGRPFERQALDSQLALFQWVVAGQPGEPLPPGVHEVRERRLPNSAPRTTIQVARRIPINVDRYPVTTMAREQMASAFAHLAHRGDSARYEADIASGIRRAIQDSPGYAYFEAFNRPEIMAPDISRALINARQVALLGSICLEHGITPDDLHLHRPARDAFDHGKREIEETDLYRLPSGAKKSLQGVERIRHHLADELSEQYARLNPDEPRLNLRPADIQMDRYGRITLHGVNYELEGAINSLVDVITGSTLRYTPEADYVHERIREAFDAPGRWAQDTILDMVTAEAAKALAHPSRDWGYGLVAERLCWLRRTPLTLAESEKQPDHERFDGSDFLSSQELDNAADTYCGEILRDARPPGDVTRLILPAPPGYALPFHPPEEPLLTIGLTPDAIRSNLNDNMPFIPGMRLVAVRSGPSGNEYDFIADTSQPDPYEDTVKQYSREQWDQMVALADGGVHEDVARGLLLQADKRTASDLALAFRSGTTYGLANNSKEAQHLTSDWHDKLWFGGRPKLQCKQAASLFVRQFQKYLSHARTISGPLQLPGQAGGFIYGLGHVQVSIQEDGRWHILEVTPPGEPTPIAGMRQRHYPRYVLPSLHPEQNAAAQQGTLEVTSIPSIEELVELFARMNDDEVAGFVDHIRAQLASSLVPDRDQTAQVEAQLQANRAVWEWATSETDITEAGQVTPLPSFDPEQGRAEALAASLAALPQTFLHNTRTQFGYLGHRQHGSDPGTWRRIRDGHNGRFDAVGITARHMKAVQPGHSKRRPLLELSASELAEAANAADADRLRILGLIERAAIRRPLPGQPRYPVVTMGVYANYLDRLAATYSRLEEIRRSQEATAQRLGVLAQVGPRPQTVDTPSEQLAAKAAENIVPGVASASGEWTLPW